MSSFAVERFAAALVGRSVDAETAVELAGGTVGERLDWSRAPSGAVAVLVVEAEGVDGATLAGRLPEIAAIAEARDLPVVVAFGAEQIDTVAAALLGSRAVLLCTPTIVERVAALAVAAGEAGSAALVREDEAGRLRRLNAEVARIAALLAGLVEEAPSITTMVDDRRGSFTGESPADVAIDPAEIRRVIRARRLRGQFFDARLVEDPGWDMLLDLFAAELEQGRVSVSSLCIAAAVAPTTALRWIGRMVDAGLLVREADAGDRRRAFLVLSASASDAMRGYMTAARRAGLPIA